MVDDVQFIAGKDQHAGEESFTRQRAVDQTSRSLFRRPPPRASQGSGRPACITRCCGLVVICTPPTMNCVLAILQTRSMHRRKNYPASRSSRQAWLVFLAHRITTTSVCLSALTRLFRLLRPLVAARINMDLTQDCLADVPSSSASERKVSVEEFASARFRIYFILIDPPQPIMVGPSVCAAYGARVRSPVSVAQDLYWPAGWPEIGRRFGRARSHPRVCTASNASRAETERDVQIAEIWNCCAAL